MKVVNTPGLLELARAAERAGYNRQLDLKELRREVDPFGTHVLEAWMVHGHAAGVQVEDHLRCKVYIKAKDQDLPAEAWLDVPFDRYNALADAEPLTEAPAECDRLNSEPGR